MNVTEVKIEGMVCISGKTSDGTTISDGGNASTGSVTEGDAKVWGGNIFDEEN
jgi:hypothetical protein